MVVMVIRCKRCYSSSYVQAAQPGALKTNLYENLGLSIVMVVPLNMVIFHRKTHMFDRFYALVSAGDKWI